MVLQVDGRKDGCVIPMSNSASLSRIRAAGKSRISKLKKQKIARARGNVVRRRKASFRTQGATRCAESPNGECIFCLSA